MPDDPSRRLVNDTGNYLTKGEHGSYPPQRRLIDVEGRRRSIREYVDWVLKLAVSIRLQIREQSHTSAQFVQIGHSKCPISW